MLLVLVNLLVNTTWYHPMESETSEAKLAKRWARVETQLEVEFQVERLLRRNQLEEKGFPTSLHLRFVSFSPRDGHLRLLLFGKCPCCNSQHLRGVCNIKHDIASFVTPEISEVRTCSVVQTFDRDFNILIRRLGLAQKYMEAPKDVLPRQQWIDSVFYQHPLVKANVRYVVRHDNQLDPVHTSPMSRDEFLNTYFIAWKVDDFTSVVVTIDGKHQCLTGLRAICQQQQSLPDGLDIQRDHVLGVTLLVADSSFCRSTMYVEVIEN